MNILFSVDAHVIDFDSNNFVSKQGTIVDRIDYNITNVAVSVEDGLKQLQKVHILCLSFPIPAFS